MKLQNLFTDGSGIPRSGWRFLMFLVAFSVLASFASGGLTVAAAAMGYTELTGRPGFIIVNSFVLAALTVAATWAAMRFLEKEPFSDFGLAPTAARLRELLTGIWGGTAAFGTACLIGWAAGGMSFSLDAEFEVAAVLRSMAVSLGVLFVAAAFEELLFRGYLLQTMARSGHQWLGIVLTSALFASAHGANPSVNRIALLNTILAGVWFGVAYLKTRNLWLATGLHVSWNWTQGNIFGIEISGLDTLITHPVMRETDIGPTWLTGGDYGIEGGIACTAALVVSIGVVGAVKRVDGRR